MRSRSAVDPADGASNFSNSSAAIADEVGVKTSGRHPNWLAPVKVMSERWLRVAAVPARSAFFAPEQFQAIEVADPTVDLAKEAWAGATSARKARSRYSGLLAGSTCCWRCLCVARNQSQSTGWPGEGTGVKARLIPSRYLRSARWITSDDVREP